MSVLIHHLHKSQSERVIWLCEELGVPYTIKDYDRAPLFAPPEYRALHPQGTAPVIQHGDLTLAESGACIEYICNTLVPPEQRGALAVQPGEPEYPHFLYWWHWVNATFLPAVVRLLGLPTDDDNPRLAMARDRLQRALNGLNDRLAQHQWLGGDQFTVADIMAVFPLTTMRYFLPYSLKEHEHIVKYLERVGEREAYQRAMNKGDPGMELVLGADPPSKTML